MATVDNIPVPRVAEEHRVRGFKQIALALGMDASTLYRHRKAGTLFIRQHPAEAPFPCACPERDKIPLLYASRRGAGGSKEEAWAPRPYLEQWLREGERTLPIAC